MMMHLLILLFHNNLLKSILVLSIEFIAIILSLYYLLCLAPNEKVAAVAARYKNVIIILIIR